MYQCMHGLSHGPTGNTLYSSKFHRFSHGFREGHSQHMALDELRK